MRVMVTGVGQLGNAVIAECNQNEIECIGLVRHALDITDLSAIKRFIQEFNPTTVINCAAYTDVDGAEKHVSTAIAVNVMGAANLAEALLNTDARMIHISTDYVFDGRKTVYRSTDIPSPLSVYGMSKLAGECAVTATLKKRALIVRTSWVYGLGGSISFPEKALVWAKRKKSVKIEQSQVSVPTYAPDLAHVLVKLAGEEWFGDIIHIVGGGGGTTRGEWAQVVYEAAKREIEVIPAEFEDFETVARRPAWSELVSDVDLPDWRESTKEFVKKICKRC